MSHVGQYACSLGAVNTEVLRKALTFLAQKLDGKVTSSITDFYGNTFTEWEGKPLIAAMSLPGVKYGIGITQNSDGTLNFVGDKYRCGAAFDKATSDIEFAYCEMAAILGVAAALRMKLKKRQETDEDTVVLKMGV